MSYVKRLTRGPLSFQDEVPEVVGCRATALSGIIGVPGTSFALVPNPEPPRRNMPTKTLDLESDRYSHSYRLLAPRQLTAEALLLCPT